VTIMQLIDANIFLEVELEQQKADACKHFLRKVAEGTTEAILTDFALDSILIVMERNGKSASTLQRFLASILAFKGIHIYSLTMVDKLLATKHMIDFSLDFDDSLAVQAMHANTIKEIVSLDSDFDNVKGISRMEP
jgi:uncharacterized protein